MLSAPEHDQNVKAMDMILKKIVEDPLSSSCPNISYQDYKGPVASSNPTGSPFAANPLVATPQNGTPDATGSCNYRYIYTINVS